MSPALLSFFGLITIQVSVGLVYKLSQRNGKYEFSTASAMTIAEFFKLIMAFFMFSTDVCDRRTPFLVRVLSTYKQLQEQLSKPLVIKLFGLASLYAVNNHVAFATFQLADPGTIQLVKSGSTLISAVLTYCFLARHIASIQWLAIVLQVCGLITTQYNPEAGLHHSVPTYSLLFFSTAISAAAGCWNDNLCKTYAVSVHAQNTTLYIAGTALNLALFFIRSAFSEEKGFFEGYDNIMAVLVVFLNACIGIAITMVYKYADNIVKSIAVAVSTTILIIASAVLFNGPSTILTYNGAVIILLSTYLYMTWNVGVPPGAKDANQVCSLCAYKSTDFLLIDPFPTSVAFDFTEAQTTPRSRHCHFVRYAYGTWHWIV
ncbi:nucleotide-sugar transporter-domain-containing protein [Gaertneriomyces semiglobifer]|nr:nucleotide-sugar transporter-domain-containing protein [Gaertneriomyces semiglobifer]